MAVPNTYILIDFENVQAEDFELLETSGVDFKVFLGSSIGSVFRDGAAGSRCGVGRKVEYIEVSGTGREAVRFQIALHIGRVSEAEPAAIFWIISSDTGFDPLMRNMKQLGVKVYRSRRYLPGRDVHPAVTHGGETVGRYFRRTKGDRLF